MLCIFLNYFNFKLLSYSILFFLFPDVLIQHSTESLGVEVLLSPTVRTLTQCVKNLLSTHTSHKQLIHAGYTFAGSGSWILENGTFSFAEFQEIFRQACVQNQKRCVINVHCTEEGDWSQANFTKDIFSKRADVSLNPPTKLNHVPGSEHLIKCLDSALVMQNLEEMMKPSPLVGNIRFNRPTLYMFPAGQGDCALFGINGFNMLIDGGFHRKPCSWDFIRHLDRLDAVLVTRLAESNVSGMSTLMKRNSVNNANPQIGYVFCNIAENKSNATKNGTSETKDDLIISVVGEGHNFVQTLNDLNLKPHQCWRDSSIDPFVLYHKVGQGTLEMHVLSPPRDSKEMKQFLTEWNAYKETFSGVKSELKGVEHMIPLSHATSICAILVWRPEDPKDTITRILFPGSAPQYKILEGLEKLKVLNILNHPVVTKSCLNIPVSKVIKNKVEKAVTRASIPNRNNTASPALSISSAASRNGDIGGIKKDVREIKRVSKEIKKDVKKEVKKEIKKDLLKEVKKDVKSEITVKKDSLAKKEIVKDVKKEAKDIKKVVKKENKDIKAVKDKKEVKPAPKKDSLPNVKAAAEVKKAATAAKKSITPVKKDAGKPPVSSKATSDTKKAPPKASELKMANDVANKKTVESKTVNKTKPKTTPSSKTATSSKTKPLAVAKPGSKMTKAVAASSVIASAVAVTVAAAELNEKKEVIEDTEPEIVEKEAEIIAESKEPVMNEKSIEEIVSPLPPEALSPTPSDSVSLTPSDTLSSAPLETVSPTPPLANEPVSTEEKDVNEIKDLEQDIPYEQEKLAAAAGDDDFKTDNEVDIEAELAKLQTSNDAMSASFIARTLDNTSIENELENTTIEQSLENTDFKPNGSAPMEPDLDKDDYSEKGGSEDEDIEEEKSQENDVVENKNIVDEQQTYEEFNQEKDVVDEKDVEEEHEVPEEKNVQDDLLGEKGQIESYVMEEGGHHKEKTFSQETYFAEENNVIESETAEAAFSEEGKLIEDTTKEIYTVSKNLGEEKDFEEREFADGDIVEEKDDDKEKDTLGELKMTIDDQNIDNFAKNNFENSYNANEENDERLAGLTMEGSFCGGMELSSEKNMPVEKSQMDNIKTTYEQSLNYQADAVEQRYEEIATKSETETLDQTGDVYVTQQAEGHENITEESCQKDAYPNQLANNEIAGILNNYETHSEEPQINDYQSNENDFAKFSHIHPMEASFHQDVYGNYDPANIDDLDMQETSVDEPEEIMRKDSGVSITLNDENIEQNYIDNLRLKSGTESDDDVDIGKYMSKEPAMDAEKLYARRGSDSDDEDVVKSPTPHAVVDYKGQLDDVISNVEHKFDANESEVHTGKETFSSEKNFCEKDRDSAEDQDTDDGEMIRHPTPPGMKYSEEDMRDPIGQHFITNPNLKPQVSDITEQPLYEESESDSERSVSPIIEQPVFGNVAEADFPELVTVSGGTTPSEPQSPKANFDPKKFGADAALMEAVSEHDISESSTHSPSCQDGSTAFDLHGSETSVIEVQSLRDEEVLKVAEESKQEALIENIPSDISAEDSGKIETSAYDDKDDKQEEKQESPSDEEESSSEDENSESHSKDKSDAMGDKSDVERDDRSDVHTDDRSDHHHDKSDVVNDDDDDKSDIAEDEHQYKQDKHMDYAMEDGFQRDLKATELRYDTENIQYDKSLDVLDQHVSNNEQEYDMKSSTLTDSCYYEKGEAADRDSASYSNDKVYPNVPLPVENRYEDYHLESSVEGSTENVLEYKLKDAYDSHELHYDYQTSLKEPFMGKESDASDHQLDMHNMSMTETENVDITESKKLHTFQTDEINFENSKQYSGVHGFSTFGFENENENAAVGRNSEDLLEMPDYAPGVPSGFETSDNIDSYRKSPIHEDLTHQFSENVPPVENKILSEISDVNKYENLTKYEVDSGDSSIKNITPCESQIDTCYMSTEESNVSGVNFDNFSSRNQSFALSSTYEYSEKSGASHNDYGMDDPIHNFKNTDDYKHLEANYLHSEQFETTSEDIKTQKAEMLIHNEFRPEVIDLNSNDQQETVADGTVFTTANGKDLNAFSLPSTEMTTEYFGSPLSHQEVITSASQQVEQESTYLINNRFQSDSPEDNTMRSDSSPDVPYPAHLADKLSDIKNSMSLETSSETYIHNTEDFKNNMNFSNTEAISVSTENHTLNANQNNTYVDSSDDERNSSVRGNVSPFAYTNKAYAREDEDIDGNHIYQEETTTEVIKQVELDDNNLQTLGTNQVGSAYSQEYQSQYSTGANYDFHLEEWGKPMGLPTPPDSSQKTAKKSEKGAVKSKTTVDANGKLHSPSVSSKVSSPLKKPKPKVAKESSSSPIYVDLAYVPQHADPNYCDVEFFKKIRARYYVISSVNPSKEVLNALLEAKKTWNEDLSVTIIPTYETDTLGYWMAQNQNDLAEYSIDVSPSASRCTVNLQDHQTSCSAYRLEF